MFRIEVYMGKKMGWKMGINSYTAKQLVERLEKLDKAGIICRSIPEKYLYI
jgi:hypothetical protein